MAAEIKQIILDIVIGNWDYVYKNEVADLITLIIIFMFIFCIYNLIKWLLRMGKSFYD